MRVPGEWKIASGEIYPQLRTCKRESEYLSLPLPIIELSIVEADGIVNVPHREVTQTPL